MQLAEQLDNVSQACKLFGYSRDSFYRFKELYDQGGEVALRELNRRKPNLKNRIEEEVEQVVVQIVFDIPAFGQLRASNELKKKESSFPLQESVACGCAMICKPLRKD